MRHWKLACVVVLLAPAAARAQYGFPYAYGYSPSTAAESQARGIADAVRSAGMANLMNSEAAKRYQQARSQDLENRLKATETYFEMRRLNQQYREAERKGSKPSTEVALRIAQSRKPSRLSPAQLDPVTGGIDWPIILRNGPYAAYTAELAKLFEERAQSSHVFKADEYQRVEELISACQADLLARLKDYKPQDYIDAKKFLDGMAYEARFPAG